MGPVQNRLFVVVFVIAFLAVGCSPLPEIDAPAAVRGEINLANWNFDEVGKVSLNGEWEFYWNRLLTYDVIAASDPDLIVDVPNSWNNYELNGTGLPGQGFATYRLRVNTVLPQGTIMGLRIYTMSSAYRLFVNEREVAASGRVSPTAEGEIGEYRPQAVFFAVPAQEFDIIIQVSNYQYARGGLWYGTFLGTAGGIAELHERTNSKEAFLLGALLIVSLFYFTVFFLRRELKYTLYFALLCLFMMLVVDMVGQFILLQFLPGIGLSTVIFLWYASVAWCLFFLIMYVHQLYPSGFSQVVSKTYLVLAVLLTILYLLTAPLYYSRYGLVSNYIDIAAVFSVVVIVAAAAKRGDKTGILNLVSMFVVFITIVHQ